MRFKIMLGVMLLAGGWARVVNAVEVGGRLGLDPYQLWRTDSARILAARKDVESIVTAALLTAAGPPSRSKAEAALAATAAHDLAVRANRLAPNDPAFNWLELKFCADAVDCDTRDPATSLRWVDAENGIAWIPTLSAAQIEKDDVQVDRILNAMAQGTRFDVYANRMVAMTFDTLRRSRALLSSDYPKTDVARLRLAIGMAQSEIVPSFSPLINACREPGTFERRANCYKVARLLQQSDTVMAQTVGFAMERRLMLADGRDTRQNAERRWVLDWRVAMANEFDTPKLGWLKDSRARSRLKKMREIPREEDVCVAILREHHFPTEPPEER